MGPRARRGEAALAQWGPEEELLLGHGQAMLVQLLMQVSQEDTSFYLHLLLLRVDLQETAQAGRN